MTEDSTEKELEEFREELRKHDWHYMYSDDGRVYRRGADNEARLRAVAKHRGGKFLEAFDAQGKDK